MWSRDISVTCDFPGCEAKCIGSHNMDASEVWDNTRNAGWVSASKSQEKGRAFHFCPECSKKLFREES